ncbi:hypothetical protein ACVGWR_01665, partial [Enterobacter hormaechei]
SISKAIRHRKNNTLRLLPGGAGLGRGFGFVCRVIAAPPGNSKPKANTTRTAGMLKKILSVSLVGPFVVFCLL